MQNACIATLVCVTCGIMCARADTVFYAYEGAVLPYDPSAGWVIFQPCEAPDCAEWVEDGHYVTEYSDFGNPTNYHRSIPVVPETMWIEWHRKSNFPFLGLFPDCDGVFVVRWATIHALVTFYGDLAFSSSGQYVSEPFEVNEWHLFRFESVDGVDFDFAVDGKVFWNWFGIQPIGSSYMQFRSNGGCGPAWFPGMKGEWDFIRYGEITYGEEIVASDPPGGVLSPVEHGNLTQFAVTYDSPNYVYVNEISVTTAAPLPNGESPPQVLRTGRYDNGSPDTVVITLDKPIPLNGETTFTFFDGTITGEVSYSFKPGDADGDGDVDLPDYAAFATCFSPGPAGSEPEGICTLFDVAGNPDFPRVGLPDYSAFADIITGPQKP